MKKNDFNKKIYIKHVVEKYQEKTLLNKTKEELLSLLGVLNPTAAKFKTESTKPEIVNELNNQIKILNKELKETKNRVLKKRAEETEKLFTFCDKSMKNNINNTPLEEVNKIHNLLLLNTKEPPTKESKVKEIYQVYNEMVGDLKKELNSMQKKSTKTKKTSTKTNKKTTVTKKNKLKIEMTPVSKKLLTKENTQNSNVSLKQKAAEALKENKILMFIQPEVVEQYKSTVYLDKEEDVSLLKIEVSKFNNKVKGVQILPSVTVTRFQQKPKQFVNSLEIVQTEANLDEEMQVEAVLFLQMLKDIVGLN